MENKAAVNWKRDTQDMLRRSKIKRVQISDETQLLYSWLQKFGDEKYKDVSFNIDSVQTLHDYLVKKEKQRFRAVYAKKRSTAREDENNANS